MDSKRQTESVLAKLMGLERPPPSKLLVYGRRRVHSESYLQDIALISQHQKWSFDRFSMDVDDRMIERRDSSEDLQSSSSSEESLQRCRTEDEMFQKLWSISSSQKAGKGYSSIGGSYSPKKMESVSQTPMRNVHQNQKMLSSNAGKAGTFSFMRKKGTGLGKRERDCLSGREALRNRSMATNGIAKQVADSLQHSAWHDYLKGSQNQDDLDATLAKLNSLPGKMNTVDSKVGDEQCISNSMSFPASGSSICKNKKLKVHKDWCLDPMNEDSSYCKSRREINSKSEEDLTMRNCRSITRLHSEKDVSCEETPSAHIDSSEYVEKDLFEENPTDCVPPKEFFGSSDVESLSSVNKAVDDAFMPFHQQDNAFMPFHQQDNGSQPCQMDAYKPNHSSASNIKNISSAAHPSAFHGSEVKLQQSVAKLYYPEAKRHKRIDVKDAKKGGDQNHSQEIITGIYKNEETWALPYLIDVLAESGLQYGKLETCYKLGKPLENSVNPFVFDSLETKYSKEPSWLKSDRRLLFDRIKCALSDILHPNTGMNPWRTYKTERLLFHCNQDIIREEILSMLVNQEKEGKRVPSEKAVGLDCDWLDLEEDMIIALEDTH
ncbi:hypothetical protein V2J09_001348 [Rumex salicifolius]